MSEKKFNEMYGQDLAGWQICPVFFLKLQHGLMGLFPAQIRGSRDDIILATSRADLEHVWNLLEPRRATIHRLLVVYNKETGKAYQIDELQYREDRLPLRIRTTEEIRALTAEDVEWAPGLLDLSDAKVTPPSFSDAA